MKLQLTFVFAVGMLAGCYEPSIEDCAYRCAPGVPKEDSCPDGMFCDSENFCVGESQLFPCGGGPPLDDAGVPDDGFFPRSCQSSSDCFPDEDCIGNQCVPAMPDGGMPPPPDGMPVTGADELEATSIRERSDDVTIDQHGIAQLDLVAP